MGIMADQTLQKKKIREVEDIAIEQLKVKHRYKR